MTSIIGIWKLVAAAAHDGAGSRLPAPYGAKLMGRVTFNADGRKMTVLCDGRRPVTRVDAASDPARLGTDQVREVRFEGDRMILRPPPRPRGELTEHRELSWQRIARE